jgi:ribosome maturation factor RimP
MISTDKADIVGRITALGDRVAAGTSIEIVEVQFRGSGKARLLRVYIDKPGGVTHGDCEMISERLGKLLDDEGVIPGDSYTLEVSSPGAERKLSTTRDFERVVGKKLKLLLVQPHQGQASLEGRLRDVSAGVLALEHPGGELFHIPLDQVRKANLKFDW